MCPHYGGTSFSVNALTDCCWNIESTVTCCLSSSWLEPLHELGTSRFESWSTQFKYFNNCSPFTTYTHMCMTLLIPLGHNDNKSSSEPDHSFCVAWVQRTSLGHIQLSSSGVNEVPRYSKCKRSSVRLEGVVGSGVDLAGSLGNKQMAVR